MQEQPLPQKKSDKPDPATQQAPGESTLFYVAPPAAAPVPAVPAVPAPPLTRSTQHLGYVNRPGSEAPQPPLPDPRWVAKQVQAQAQMRQQLAQQHAQQAQHAHAAQVAHVHAAHAAQAAALQRQLPTGPPPGFQPQVPPLPPLVPAPLSLQGEPDARLVLITDPDSDRAQSYRTLRDNLLAKRLPKILAISSANKKEGKTTCAVNLALSLSEGARVLILDANPFEPALAQIFCIDENTSAAPQHQPPPWLNPYKIGAFSPTLHVAALVLPPGASTPRLEKHAFEQLLGSLRRVGYDYIVIDVAALSVSPMVTQLVATADATLLTVKAGVTTARALRRATEQIPEGKAIGVALIDSPPEK